MTAPQTVRLTAHADVVAAATDPVTFSSRTSTHLHVPNGMDGTEHAAFRAVVERYMDAETVAGLSPMLAEVAREAVAALPRDTTIDAVHDLGEAFAVRAQRRWLGWQPDVESELRAWMQENYAAAAARDPERNAAVAAAFDALVRRQVDAAAPGSVTHRLTHDGVDGRALTTAEVVSILRNWTAGDLGSLARCIGVVVLRIADDAALQDRMRTLSEQATARADAELDAMVEECLRADDPFVANRRVATCPVTLPSGIRADEGSRVLLEWAEANRDPAVFSDEFSPEDHAADTLVFGIGPHVCPGRALSLAELRAAITALLASTTGIERAPDAAPVAFEAPLGGWRTVPVVLR